jgi:hypothetical protein
VLREEAWQVPFAQKRGPDWPLSLVEQEEVGCSVTIAKQPIVEAAGVLLINAASFNPDITYKAGIGGYKWSLRNCPTDEVRASVVLNMPRSRKA